MNSEMGESLSPEHLLRHDYQRLYRQWVRLQRATPERLAADRPRWQGAYDAARQRFADRQAVSYRLAYDPELPISRYRDSIIDWIQHRQVIVVCGETGSGKSTQLPKLCLEAGLGRYGWIGHTQPRRLAARSIAHRLSEELETPFGQVVGYKVRFQDQTQPSTLIKLMTDGVLLTEIHRDPDLEAYDCILIDEAHERSINIDLLLAYLSRLIHRRPELRVVITSATIDAERFSEHFHDAIGPAPIINIEGRGYPVEIRYRGASSMRWSEISDEQYTEREEKPVAEPEFDGSMLGRFCDAVDELFEESMGDILAFFATERDIRDAAKRLRGHLMRRGWAERIDVLPLYARLTEAEQQRVFQSHSKPRIVLATNVAESSLTVPGIRYVIDTGTARISRFAAKSRVQRLPIEPICQASANQRSGRCGRLGPGIAIRLFDEADYLARPLFAQPEIRRCDLASTILHTKSLGIDELESLPWLDPPRPETVREGLHTLREIEAIDEQDKLTAIGRSLAHWPVSPRIGRMLIAADRFGCLHEMLIIAAALETQDPRVRPPEMQSAADAAHLRFRDPNSDFLSYLRIWDFYQSLREKLGRSRLERACRENFLSLVRLREWGDVHRQLTEQCRESKLTIGPRRMQLAPLLLETNPSREGRLGTDTQSPPANRSQRFPDGYDSIHQSILTGMLSGVAMFDDQGRYRGASNMELQLWPGSCLKQTNAKWIVSSEIVETTQRYARTLAKIDPTWIEPIAGHCIKYSYDSPHFSRKHGSAMVMRKGSLFGLPVVTRHAVSLAPLDRPLARQLLIEHGLAERELVSQARFWQHNERFLNELKKFGDKSRRRDCIADPFRLLAYYQTCIPEHVVDRASLESWDRDLTRTLPKASDPRYKTEPLPPPYLTWSNLQLDIDPSEWQDAYPDQLAIGNISPLPLSYSFAPGEPTDGVTLRVPVRVVDQIHREKLEWLVPGLMEEKLVALLKSLPKRLRRQLVPIPDTVKGMQPELEAMAARGEPFWKAVCACCSQKLGEVIRITDFDTDSMAPHLFMRIEAHNDAGEIVLAGRDLSILQKEILAKSTKSIPAELVESQDAVWVRQTMTQWDIEDLPKSILQSMGGVRVERYPSLTIRDGKIGTRVYDHPHIAEQMLRECWIRLVAASERREIKSHIPYLPQWSNASLWLSDRWTSEQLTDWLAMLIGRLALVETDWTRSAADFSPCCRTRTDWEALRVDRVRRIATAAAEIGRWLPKVAESYHQVRKLKESLAPNLAINRKSIQSQLDRLMDPSHVFHTPWVYVRDWPRFLAGITARLEKMKSIGSIKDLELDHGPSRAWDDYARRLLAKEAELPATVSGAKWHPTGTLLEYRWMIEEFSVSIHAQKLGTRISVSPKRIEKIQSQLATESDA
jgi:ATP-dependent helicase HrpA